MLLRLIRLLRTLSGHLEGTRNRWRIVALEEAGCLIFLICLLVSLHLLLTVQTCSSSSPCPEKRCRVASCPSVRWAPLVGHHCADNFRWKVVKRAPRRHPMQCNKKIQFGVPGRFSHIHVRQNIQKHTWYLIYHIYVSLPSECGFCHKFQQGVKSWEFKFLIKSGGSSHCPLMNDYITFYEL